MSSPLYIGLDYSTQQLKAIVTDFQSNVCHEEIVIFDRDLPNYGTVSGVIQNGSEVYTPTQLWVEATELILKRLKCTELDLSRVVAISGCGQQHGSVYWKELIENALQFSGDLTMRLNNSFTVPNSPIWMDASASKQCAEIENHFGGPLKISLVSNFAASLWVGQMIPMDYADACGTGLFSLHSAKLEKDVCEFVAPGLMQMLDAPIPSSTIVGHVSPYIADNYGLSKTCKVVAFTGDNPSCVAGLFLRKGEVCLSLGTSDTLFVRHHGLPSPNKQTLGIFVMIDPTEPDTYISLICTRNGSLVREKLCQQYANGDWKQFSALLNSSPSGNHGYMGLFLDQPEILPDNLQGRFLVDGNDKPIDTKFGTIEATFPRAEFTVRALIEGQLIRKRVYLSRMGVNVDQIKRIIVTGGASVNKEILQIAAGVFAADVYTVSSPNSAALGGAFRAKHAMEVDKAKIHGLKEPSFFDVINCPPCRVLVARCPEQQIIQTYDEMARRFEKLEHMATQVQSTQLVTELRP